MSVKAISEVMEWEISDGIAKLVAMVLADYADPVTGRCWPKIPTLARQCSKSERTVQRKLQLLEQLGRLRVEPNKSGDRTGNTYVLHLRGVPRAEKAGRTSPDGEPRTGDTLSPVHPPDPAGHESHPRGDSADTRRVTLLSPPKESVRESTKESVTDPDGSAPRRGAAERDFRKELNGRGVQTVCDLTGRPKLRCRTLIGSWLRLVDDDAVTVLRAIDEAVEAEAVEAVSWIEARLRRRPKDGPPKATPLAPYRIAERNAEATRMADRGEWPIGGSLFVEADSPAGKAWEAYFRSKGVAPRWRQCPKGWGAFLPSAMPPAIAA